MGHGGRTRAPAPNPCGRMERNRMRLKYLASGMACILVAVLCMGVLTNIKPTSGDNRQVWRLMRTVTANDTALTTSTRAWSSVVDSALFVPIPQDWTWVRFAVIAYGDGDGAGDPSAGTFNYRVFAVRYRCSAELVCTGAMAVGGLTLSHYPYGSQTVLSDPTSYRFVEGPPTCTDYWSTGAEASGTTDDLGSVSFATGGSFGFGVEITSMATMTSAIIIYTGGE